jgi:hypothetical protein
MAVVNRHFSYVAQSYAGKRFRLGFVIDCVAPWPKFAECILQRVGCIVLAWEYCQSHVQEFIPQSGEYRCQCLLAHSVSLYYVNERCREM